jgi:hypothetical protein
LAGGIFVKVRKNRFGEVCPAILDTKPLSKLVLLFSLTEEIVPYAKAYLPTEQPPPGQDTWVQGQDGD